MAPGKPRRHPATPPPTTMHANPTLRPSSSPDIVGSVETIDQDTTIEPTMTRKGRGKTRGLALLRMIRAGKKIKINIPEGKNKAVGDGSELFTTEIGIISRQYLSLQVPDYSTFQEKDKEACYRLILDKFDIDLTKPHVKMACESYMRDRFNKHRHRLHKVFQKYPSRDDARQHLPKDIRQDDWDYLCTYFSSDSYQKRSKINKENWAKLKVSHIMGTKSFCRAHHEKRNQETEEEPDRIEFWKICHYNKEKGCWSDPIAEKIYEEMVELQARSELEGNPMTVDEICDQVLGRRSGYVLGLGHGPKPKSTFQRRDNLQAIEDARKRAEVAERRATELGEQLESQQLQIKNQQLEISSQKTHIDTITTRQSEMEAMLRSILSNMQPPMQVPAFP